MDSGDSVASSSSPSTKSWKHDVFLSFRGADTGNNFTDHLYSKLHQIGVEAFRDEDFSIRFQAIKKSRIFVVIFSENYASSRSCLDELVKILECRRESKERIVIPIFYKVDRSYVGKQTGPYHEAFANHEDRFKNDKGKVGRWRTALKEAADLSGWNFSSNQRESKFIHDIVENISQVLNRTHLKYEAKYPVEIDSRVQEIYDLLGVGVRDVRMIGIWGDGGIGKTTLAKAVYNGIAHRFKHSCFLENVRESSMAPGGLDQLQKILVDKILGVEVTAAGSRIKELKEMLRTKAILLILDDVYGLDQLKILVGRPNRFGAGSRIIITTRDEKLLADYQVDLKYQVKGLEFDEAAELFSSNAFPSSRIPNDYKELANGFVNHAQGHPLALTAMGSLLHGKSIAQWQSMLRRYETAPTKSIREILKITKKALEHPVKVPTQKVP